MFCKNLKSFGSPIILLPVYLMKVIPETRCVPKFDIYVLIMHAMPKFVQIKHTYTCGQKSFSLIKIVHSLTCHWGGGGVISHLPSYLVVVPNNFSFITIMWADVFAMDINSKTFSISALVSSRDSHIKPDTESGWLIWVEGW
jgi:hypothetical protein